MVKISIIIPVYNTEQYIEECLESIVCQNFIDFEAIFVDDDSQDASFAIIKEFAKRDRRIKLYHQNKAGVSVARNLGLKHAQGDYIVFIDSDDTITSNYLDQLYQCVTKNSPDIVLSGLINVKQGCEENRVALEDGLLSLQTESDLIHFFKTPLLTPPFPKLYRRKIICDNNILFDPSISFAEDKDFNLQYFQYIRNAYALPFCGYFYRDVENSLSHKKYEYQYRIEHRHWQVKRKMFERLHDTTLQSKSYLVNQLFYIVYDEMSDIVYSTQSIMMAMEKWRKSMQYIDFEYLRENYSLLEQPLWMKVFLKRKLFRSIFTILKIRRIIFGEAAG